MNNSWYVAYFILQSSRLKKPAQQLEHCKWSPCTHEVKSSTLHSFTSFQCTAILNLIGIQFKLKVVQGVTSNFHRILSCHCNRHHVILLNSLHQTCQILIRGFYELMGPSRTCIVPSLHLGHYHSRTLVFTNRINLWGLDFSPTRVQFGHLHWSLGWLD